jgi:hypothetical protein
VDILSSPCRPAGVGRYIMRRPAVPIGRSDGKAREMIVSSVRAAMEGRLQPRPVDSLDVTILVDNSVDVLMAGSDRVKRAPLHRDWSSMSRWREAQARSFDSRLVGDGTAPGITR